MVPVYAHSSHQSWMMAIPPAVNAAATTDASAQDDGCAAEGRAGPIKGPGG